LEPIETNMALTAKEKRYAAEIARRLGQTYPGAKCALDFADPLELLVATILSAQCTDKRVNVVTKDLFRKYRSAADYAAAAPAELEKDIQSTGFFRNKAKAIQGCCQAMLDRFEGQVPRDLDTLVQLPGIGRKTANVILGAAFGVASGIAVDTHVGRLSRRLGLSAHKDPVKVERDLMDRLPQEQWLDFTHQLVQHGRTVCIARKPKCDECPLGDICPRIGVEQKR
jgi:endonuclease III